MKRIIVTHCRNSRDTQLLLNNKTLLFYDIIVGLIHFITFSSVDCEIAISSFENYLRQNILQISLNGDINPNTSFNFENLVFRSTYELSIMIIRQSDYYY